MAALLLQAALVALLLGPLPAAWAGKAAPGPVENEADLLLTFKAGITNWDEVAAARKLQGWKSCDVGPDCLPVCTWSGVECNPYHSHMGNSVTALRLSCRTGCTVPLRGQLTYGIHRLQHLAYLYVDGNELSGPLPEAWGEPHSFMELLELNLNDNQLTGNVPDVWSVGPAFENLADLQLAGNRLSGPFPASFAITNTSFWSVMSFNFANNQMTGPLPSYVNGMITMSIVRLENNLFTGTLPPEWGTQGYFWQSSYNSTQALEYLTLHGNCLTGTLPPEWGGPGSFMALKQLTLSDNPGLNGTLPAAWGASNESLPALKDLNVSNTVLSGSLPAWGPYPTVLRALTVYGANLSGTIPSSWSQLAYLEKVIVQPGNPDLCPKLPVDSKFNLCDATDVLCIETLPSDTKACAEAQLPPGDSGGSSFPVVVVVVVVGSVAVLVTGGLLWQRRQRRRAADQRAASAKKCAYQDAESGHFYASSKQLPNLQGGLGGQAVIVAGGQNGMCAWGPTLGQSRSAELEELPSIGTASGLAAAQSAPLWLPPCQHNLLQFQSGVTLPRQPSGGDSSDSAPCLSAKELSAMQLSDWEIRPDEIEIVKRADGTEWQLGSGGFGTVYKAMRNSVQPVAVKVLGSVNSSQVLKSMSEADFAHEIFILHACRDTNILQFQGACFQDKRTLLVTEYMEGGNLAHNLRCKNVNWYRKGKKIAIDVARALVYLHSRRILHLDIKSANVLLTRDGTAKVGDVGMAKIMAGDYVSGGLGTLAWSAPELLMGQRCGAKADVYSFGVVLWEICTGELPVRGQLRDPVVPDECPAEVVVLMYRCLSPDASVRPSSTELVERLMEAGGTLPPALQAAMCPTSSTMALLPPTSMASPFGTVSPACSGVGPGGATSGRMAPSTGSISDAGGQAGSHHSSLGCQRLQSGTAPPRSLQRMQQQDGEPASVASDSSAPGMRQYVSAGKAITVTAVRVGSARPPRPAHTSSLQSPLEENLMSELSDKLSGEGLPSTLANSSSAPPRSSGSRSSREVDSGAGLQRRLVLTSSGTRSSPFIRHAPPSEASNGDAALPLTSPRLPPFTRPPPAAVIGSGGP